MTTFFSVIFVTLMSSCAFAQIDPTSGMLLDSTERQSSRDDGLDSGRYIVRPRSTPKRVVTPSATPSPAPTAAPTASPTATPTATPVATPTPAQTPVVEASATATATVTVVPATPSPAATQSAEVEGKKKFNRRTALLEFSLAPVYIYTDSESSYWYRSYHMSSPGAHVNANVWLTDNFGLHSSFMTTLGSSVKDSVDSSRTVGAAQNWFDLGVRFRHFSSDKPKASALVLGLDWSEYRMNTSNTATMRQRLITTGLQVSAGLEVPTSKHYMWTGDVSLLAKGKHKELATTSSAKSGTGNETNRFGASVGGVFRIDSGNAYFWKVSHSIEKNVFTGSATTADPISGLTPTGVSVTNSSTFLEIGCTWGD